MSQIRLHNHKQSSNFTIVPNHILYCDYLLPDEKLLLIWCLSKPDNFGINLKSLSTQLSVGSTIIKRISKSLQKENHLYIQKLSTGETLWHFFERQSECLDFKPQVENRPKGKKPQVENPHVENPHVDNQPVLVSTDLLTSTDQRNINTEPKNSSAVAMKEMPNYSTFELSDINEPVFDMNTIQFNESFEQTARVVGFAINQSELINIFHQFIGHHLAKQTVITSEIQLSGLWRSWCAKAKGYRKATDKNKNILADSAASDWHLRIDEVL